MYPSGAVRGGAEGRHTLGLSTAADAEARWITGRNRPGSASMGASADNAARFPPAGPSGSRGGGRTSAVTDGLP